MMKEIRGSGVLFNFTWDELSPLLGVDPQIMYNTIREVGVEHFTLSSDAGEPLFPDSVEAMRLVRGYMEAFGLNQDELYTVCTKNPAKVVGLAVALIDRLKRSRRFNDQRVIKSWCREENIEPLNLAP